MTIIPIDQDQNLFVIKDVIPTELVNKIMTTDWLSLTYSTDYPVSNKHRRKIDNHAIPWKKQWDSYIDVLWVEILDQLGSHAWPYQTYPQTSFYLDQPGFHCGMHHDGALIGAMQLYWIGDSDTGTCFYHTRNYADIRYHFSFLPNQGYFLITKPTAEHYTPLQWHAVPESVRPSTFRVSSYTRATSPPQPAWTV